MTTTNLRAPAELESLVGQLPGCGLLIDSRYRIVAANAAYLTCCGEHAADGAVGRRCFEVSHGYDAPCSQFGESCPLQTATNSGHAERCVHVHHTSDGAEHVEVEVTPLRDASGAVTLFLERMEKLQTAGIGDMLVGQDVAFLKTLALVKRVAPSETSVLLLGETGTGKEVLARAIHDFSERASGPFVVVDCAGLTESLFESELFGHERGAFTGATTRKPGLVEAAADGTLFIDEVGDIPLALQVKLLRVLESGLFRRVGSTDMQRTRFRLVAATHRDLASLVAKGEFRSDLYYRISTFPIVVPPLRLRRRDIAVLAESLLRRLPGGSRLGFSAETLRALEAYEFPGNVRELRNVVERASLLADRGRIEIEHLPAAVQAAALLAPETEPTGASAGVATIDAMEREGIRAAVAQHHGTRRDLAVRLGVSERTLYRKLRKLRSG